MSTHLLPLQQGNWAEPTKFDQLRNRAEMQLVHLINTELNSGIRDARHALRSADAWAIAGRPYCRAKKLHARVLGLISLVLEITAEERSHIESKMGYLSDMLESLSAVGSVPTPAEAKIAAFARAVWKLEILLKVVPKRIGFERSGH